MNANDRSRPEPTKLKRTPRPEPTVVGIGASAGGLAALKTFFHHVPADSGLAFVVVVHLSPEHESHLADLLQPHVAIPVQQVTETMPLEPNHVYVIPPNANLNTIDTHLRLSELEEKRRERAPIDHFFRTLASTHDGHAIGVILTGTGSDGTLGIKDIKAKGGLVIVQDPNEAEYDGMPQSAIATGTGGPRSCRWRRSPPQSCASRSTTPRLPLREDAEEVTEGRRQLSAEDVRAAPRPHRTATSAATSAPRSCDASRAACSCNHIEELPGLSREAPRAAGRGPRAGGRSADHGHELLPRPGGVREAGERRHPGGCSTARGRTTTCASGRVGCATGEEAYSLAMLLVEEAGARDSPPQIQIFASRPARALARQGARGLLSGRHRSRCRRRAAEALLPEGGRRLPHPQGGPRPGRVRAPQSAGRPALLPARSDRLPQPADLPAARRAARRHRAVSLRAAAGRLAGAGLRGNDRRLRPVPCARTRSTASTASATCRRRSRACRSSR